MYQTLGRCFILTSNSYSKLYWYVSTLQQGQWGIGRVSELPKSSELISVGNGFEPVPGPFSLFQLISAVFSHELQDGKKSSSKKVLNPVPSHLFFSLTLHQLLALFLLENPSQDLISFLPSFLFNNLPRGHSLKFQFPVSNSLYTSVSGTSSTLIVSTSTDR